MTEQLSVSAIAHGTVIDHIPSNQGLRIFRLLSLEHATNKITMGLHLPSKTMGSKDILKIEGRLITEAEANDIVVFAPRATINIIQQFKVVKKISTRLPPMMKNVFRCSNRACITHTEPVESCFHISEQKKQIFLTCHFCEKTYHRDHVEVMI